MHSFMIRHIYNRLHRPKPLNCPRSLWKTLLRELRKRGRGDRESGALLLGRIEGGQRFITDFIAYDDIDPDVLQGIIVFDASRMDRVWSHCEARGLQVVADVHTHPQGYGQSRVDQDHPMIPQRGHLAIIIPNFADRAYRPGQIGLYEYRGRDGWIDHSPKGADFLRLSWLS